MSMALPWMRGMTSATAAGDDQPLDRPPLRTAFLFKPNGVVPSNWTPAGRDKGEWTEMPPYLKPLAGVKDELLLLENFWNKQTDGRNGHWPKVPAWLSGGFVVRTSGRDMDTGGTSVDQVLARKIGGRTPLPSLELGVDAAYTGVDNVGGGFTRIYGSHLAWRDPHTPVPKEIIPQLAFDRLFRNRSMPVISGFNPNQKQVADSLHRDDTSILDLVLEDAKSLERKLGVDDKTKLGEYMESVRSIERRIEASMLPQRRWINEGRFDFARPGPGIPKDHEEHVRLMLDIMVLAFWTDTTRVSTFMFGNAQTGRNFAFIDGVKGAYHSLSHHREDKATRDMYEKIGIWHSKQMAYVIDRMRNLDEGGSSLLDNSILMYGSTLRDGNRHTIEDLPLIVAGKGRGAIRTGRRLTAPKKTPLCNFYRALLGLHGVDVKQFGDSSGIVEGLV